MRKYLWPAVAAVGLCLALPDLGQAGLITFDDQYVAGIPVPVNYNLVQATPLTDSYAAEGVHFSGPNNNDGTVNGGAIVEDVPFYMAPGDYLNFGVLPHSGTNMLAFNRNAQLGGSSYYYGGPIGLPGQATDPETITFDSAQSRVSIWAAGGLEAHQFLIQGFDPNNNLVSSQTLTTQGWAQLTVSAGDIQSVVLTEIGGIHDSWVYDDLSFTPSDLTIVVAGIGNSLAPEPGSFVLLSLGGLGLAGLRRRMGK